MKSTVETESDNRNIFEKKIDEFMNKAMKQSIKHSNIKLNWYNVGCNLINDIGGYITSEMINADFNAEKIKFRENYNKLVKLIEKAKKTIPLEILDSKEHQFCCLAEEFIKGVIESTGIESIESLTLDESDCIYTGHALPIAQSNFCILKACDIIAYDVNILGNHNV